MFNVFFKTKIDSLKENIDKDYVEDSIGKLRKDWNKKPDRPKFSLKQVTEQTVLKAAKKMKNKKSAGC